jgi:hypothetical protein
MKHGVNKLLERLDKAGIFASYSLLGDGNLRAYDWEKMAPTLGESTKALWRFFLLGEQQDAAKVREMIGQPALQYLLAYGQCL